MKNEKFSRFVLFLNQKTNYTFGIWIGIEFDIEKELVDFENEFDIENEPITSL